MTEHDVHTAPAEMHRVLRSASRLLVSTRPYDELLRDRPASTPPQVHQPAGSSAERTITFQLWHWHDDGEHNDLELFQLRPADGEWHVQVRRTTYWALGRDRLTGLAADAGFVNTEWRTPEDTGFFQPLLVARARAWRSPVAVAGLLPPPARIPACRRPRSPGRPNPSGPEGRGSVTGVTVVEGMTHVRS